MYQVEFLVERLAIALAYSVRKKCLTVRQHKRLNVRSSMRRNLRFAGKLFQLYHSGHKKMTPRLVVLYDIAHSMIWDDTMLLRFAHSLKKYFHDCQIFAFHPELFCVTELYKKRSLAALQRQSEDSNHLCFGGTSIA